MDKIFFMNQAIKQAKKAIRYDEVPVGAVMVYNNSIIASAFNKKETKKDATAHAEIEAIKKASKVLDSWYLDGVDMYVTLEPCAMCAGAMINARIRKVYFGAWDMRFGCGGSVLDLLSDTRFNHRVQVEGGVLAKECASLLSDFFKEKRQQKNRNEKE